MLWTRQLWADSIEPMGADAELRRRVGKRIKTARIERGLSQSQLARLLPEPVDAGYVSRWERGVNMPSWAHLQALAQVLGVTLAWLVDNGPL